jgi:hypothetical protein
MKRDNLVPIVLLLFGSVVGAAAQEAELSLYNKIVPAVERGEPQWKLHRKAILPNQVIIQWVLGRDRALVSVALLTSEADAKDRLEARVKEWEHVPEAKVVTKQLNDFGDDGYLLKTAGAKGAHILFRKGAFVIEAFGSTDDIARRFAQHVAAILPPSNNSLIGAAGLKISNFEIRISKCFSRRPADSDVRRTTH